jgi:hypothetical protein
VRARTNAGGVRIQIRLCSWIEVKITNRDAIEWNVTSTPHAGCMRIKLSLCYIATRAGGQVAQRVVDALDIALERIDVLADVVIGRH